MVLPSRISVHPNVVRIAGSALGLPKHALCHDKDAVPTTYTTCVHSDKHDMQMKHYMIKSWVMVDGERYCALIARDTGLPVFYPTLYVTSQVRNRSLSHAAMEQAHCALAVLLNFCSDASINLEARLSEKSWLTSGECSAVRDYCQKDFRPYRNTERSTVISISKAGKRHSDAPKKVAKHTTSTRLTHIAHFISWLANLLNQSQLDEHTANSIRSMEKCILALRPSYRQRNPSLDEQRGLCKDQEKELMQILAAKHERNPFHNEGIQTRNQLMIVMMRHLGIRSGELLNIRIEDIDFQKNEVSIKRRADQLDDPRRRQPLVKTLARRLLVDPKLAEFIRHYIVNTRRLIPNARKNPYLFITHKSGPTLGAPMSRANFNAVIRSIKFSSALLRNFSSHDLRHTWNERFSEWMDSKENPESKEQQEKIRENWMGWREGSGTASIYNRRFIRRKALEAGLELQASLLRTKSDIPT
ncbi:MAG: site-specific integrase [Proteobacteria bacterium]|nr:MAG: site-specific integrase [Pseudomonadota bacterium]